LPRLKAILALGAIAHNAVLAAKGLRRAAYPFAHGAMHELPDGLVLADSYHCSRLNTNTGRLTTAMFEAVIAASPRASPAEARAKDRASASGGPCCAASRGRARPGACRLLRLPWARPSSTLARPRSLK
jgi:hypothetical protein